MIIKGQNVGIGNVDPQSKLDVTGTLNASDAVTMGSSLSVASSITVGDDIILEVPQHQNLFKLCHLEMFV